MLTFPTNTLSAARRGMLSHVTRDWLMQVSAGIRAYPSQKYSETADKIDRKLQREPNRDVFAIAYASHTQRRNIEWFAWKGNA